MKKEYIIGTAPQQITVADSEKWVLSTLSFRFSVPDDATLIDQYKGVLYDAHGYTKGWFIVVIDRILYQFPVQKLRLYYGKKFDALFYRKTKTKGIATCV